MVTSSFFLGPAQAKTVEEKRRYLRTIIQKIEWDGENAAVYLFAGEGELDLASGEPSCEDSE